MENRFSRFSNRCVPAFVAALSVLTLGAGGRAGANPSGVCGREHEPDSLHVWQCHSQQPERRLFIRPV